MNRARRCLWIISLLALGGLVLSAVSLKNHYSAAPTEYCSLDETFNCDLVNRSVYSKVLGVPVALIGLIGYGLILGLARIARENRVAAVALFASSVAGLAFALYLTYIEAFVLGVWCLLCLGSLGLIAAIALLSGFTALRKPAPFTGGPAARENKGTAA